MIFSKSCEYALRSLMYLSAGNDIKKYSVKEIAYAIKSPEHFTAKILQQLARQRIIASIKGPNGGFYINDEQKSISILEVVEAIEGPGIFDKCILGLADCSEKKPCPMHEYFVNHRKELKQLFSTKSIHDLVNNNSKIILK